MYVEFDWVYLNRIATQCSERKILLNSDSHIPYKILMVTDLPSDISSRCTGKIESRKRLHKCLRKTAFQVQLLTFLVKHP